MTAIEQARIEGWYDCEVSDLRVGDHVRWASGPLYRRAKWHVGVVQAVNIPAGDTALLDIKQEGSVLMLGVPSQGDCNVQRYVSWTELYDD